MEDVLSKQMDHRRDKHTPAGVKDSSTFSYSHHSPNPPHDPETGSAVGAGAGVLEFPLQQLGPSAEA